MRVIIDAHGRRVEIDSDEDGWDTRVAARALRLWRQTSTAPNGADEDTAPAYGFSHERRSAQASPTISSMREIKA